MRHFFCTYPITGSFLIVVAFAVAVGLMSCIIQYAVELLERMTRNQAFITLGFVIFFAFFALAYSNVRDACHGCHQTESHQREQR